MLIGMCPAPAGLLSVEVDEKREAAVIEQLHIDGTIRRVVVPMDDIDELISHLRTLRPIR